MLRSKLMTAAYDSGGGGASDPYWSNVVALLHFDGDFSDDTGKIWTAQNTTFSTGVFDQASEFSQTPARSRVQSQSSADFALGTNDFTIEFFAQIDTSYNCTIIDWRSGSGSGPTIASDSGNLYMWVSGYRIGPFSGVIVPSVFHHIALTRENLVARLFLDGDLLGSASYPESITSTQVTIGANQNTHSNESEYDLTGAVDELRITNGVARYTSNFTPPTSPFPNS